MKKAVAFRAAEQINDFLPMSRRDILAFEGPALAWKKALGEHGCEFPEDIFYSWGGMPAAKIIDIISRKPRPITKPRLKMRPRKIW